MFVGPEAGVSRRFRTIDPQGSGPCSIHKVSGEVSMAENRWLVQFKLEQLGDEAWTCKIEFAEADADWAKKGAVTAPDEIDSETWPSPIEPLIFGAEWVVHEIFPPNLELGEDPEDWTEPGIEIYRDRLYAMSPRLRELEALTASWWEQRPSDEATGG
jgi:hypothetical protein